MRRWIKVFFFIVLCCPFFLLCSCLALEDPRLNKLIKCLEAEDAEKLKGLFADNTVQASENFDQDILLLIEYYKGTYVSSLSHGVLTSDSKEGFSYTRVLELCYDVKTTETDYRIAINWCTKDTMHKENVGIISLYIILYDKDEHQDKYYTVMDPTERGIFIERQRENITE